MVDQVFRILIGIVDSAGDFDLFKVTVECMRRVVKNKRYLRHIQSSAVLRSGKDNVGHLFTTERFDALFTEDPADRVGYIRFATAVRSDDAGHITVEVDRNTFGKGLKAVHFNSFQEHKNLPSNYYNRYRGLYTFRLTDKRITLIQLDSVFLIFEQDIAVFPLYNREYLT